MQLSDEARQYKTMQTTTKTIVKMLPFSQEVKTTILEHFDALTPDQKFIIEDIVWNTYYALYKLKLEENLQLALLRAKNGQEKLDGDFYNRVEEQTEKEMQQEQVEIVENVDLSAARTAMEKIINEIKAAKSAKKQ